MPSRNVLVPLNPKILPTAEDLNIIYNLLNGYFDSKKGHGMSVQLTAYDGRLSNGSTNTTKYALEVRNRELTQQRTAAFRRADNTIVAEVVGGLLKAIDPDSATPTTTAKVIVHGTPASGVLGGTYPAPTFALATEYYRVYPTMIVAWYGSAATTSRSDGYSGTNLEVTDCPGWVLCDGATVKLRSGATMSTPNMANRLPIGPGTVTYQSTAGNAWSGVGGLSAISIAHTHGFTHEHTIGAHNHDYNHTHTFAYAHTHTMNGHTHTISHKHSLANHHHTGNDLAWPHGHNHTHDVANHSHTMDDHHHNIQHDHNVDQNGSGEFISSAGSDIEVAYKDHDHNVDPNATDSNDVNAPRKWSSGPVKTDHTTAFTSTDTKTGLSTDARLSTTTSVSVTDAWTGNTSTPISTEVGISNNSTGASDTASSGSNSDNTSAASVSSGTTDNLGVGVVSTGNNSTYSTTAQSNNTTTSQSVTTINVQPPVLAWHWIMKL